MRSTFTRTSLHGHLDERYKKTPHYHKVEKIVTVLPVQARDKDFRRMFLFQDRVSFSVGVLLSLACGPHYRGLHFGSSHDSSGKRQRCRYSRCIISANVPELRKSAS